VTHYQLLLQKASLPAREIEDAADWMVKMTRCGTRAPQSKIGAVAMNRERPAP
jgi:hypothetical protein